MTNVHNWFYVGLLLKVAQVGGFRSMNGGTVNGVFGWEMKANVPIVLQIPKAGEIY